MAEVLLAFETPVAGENGKTYLARACGDEMRAGMWQGWIEFVPIGDGGEPIRSPRETTQPNREFAVYWATGLTPVFLEGSLHRALNPPMPRAARKVPPAIFDSPAKNSRVEWSNGDAVLNPFSVYRSKGEPLLRRQLSALSEWHLVNIITTHRLSDRDPALLEATDPDELVEMIVDRVKNHPARPNR